MLQALVGHRFAQRQRIGRLPAGQILEEFGGLGEASAVAAGIGLDPRTGGIERPGLDAGKAGRIADLGHRDLDDALLGAVGDHR